MNENIVAKPLGEGQPLRGFTKHVLHIDDYMDIPRKPKTWLTFMAGPGSLVDLKEMFEPIKEYFDGICAVYFGEMGDEEAIYLETNKGAGHITYLPYTGRHDLGRICALHCGVIQDDDIVVVTDTLERPSPAFCRDVGNLLNEVNTLFFFGKILAFRYHESITYVGSPHESFRRLDGQMRAVDLAQGWGENKVDEASIRANVRPLKRPPDHWVNHFARYMLLPWGSNHGLLGLDKNGDVNKLFPIREAKRLAFKAEMKRRGYPVTIEGLKAMLGGPIDARLRDLIQGDKVWSDFYWHTIKGRTDVVCGHDDRDMIKDEIPLDTPSQGD